MVTTELKTDEISEFIEQAIENEKSTLNASVYNLSTHGNTEIIARRWNQNNIKCIINNISLPNAIKHNLYEMDQLSFNFSSFAHTDNTINKQNWSMFLQTCGDVASYSNRFYMLTHNMITNELYPSITRISNANKTCYLCL